MPNPDITLVVGRPSTMVTFGELIDELLDARRRVGPRIERVDKNAFRIIAKNLPLGAVRDYVVVGDEHPGIIDDLCVPNIRFSMDAENRRGKFVTQ